MAGNDANDGLTQRTAWKSLTRFNGVQLRPGDQVILAEGQSFQGPLLLQADDEGTPENPIVIRGSGPRRATIYVTGTSAIEAESGGIEIRDLFMIGIPSADAGNLAKRASNGLHFYTTNTSGRRHRHLRIERLGITGFRGNGLNIASWHPSQPGYEDVVVREVNSHDNGGEGISVFSATSRENPGYAHRNVIITDSVVSRNASGSGIVLHGIENGLVEYSRAADNSGRAGNVGMWAHHSKNLRFRLCIAHGTKTRGKDGGGFDLDGGCVDCVIEECLAYENDGPGFMHCDFPGAGATRGNLIRNSVSINDGRRGKAPEHGGGFGFVAWGAGIDDCHILNNLAIATASPAGPNPHGLLWFHQSHTGEAKSGDDLHIRGCTMRDNIAITSIADSPLAVIHYPGATQATVRMEGNIYQARGVKPLFLWNSTVYHSEAEWAAASGQPLPIPGTSDRINETARSIVGKSFLRLKNPRQLPAFFKSLAKPPVGGHPAK